MYSLVPPVLMVWVLLALAKCRSTNAGCLTQQADLQVSQRGCRVKDTEDTRHGEDAGAGTGGRIEFQ